MSFVNLFEVEHKARRLMASEPAGNYERWVLEIFRRRYTIAEAEVGVAEAAFRDACKGGTFTLEEDAAHRKTLNDADSRRSNSRASISQLVQGAAEELEFARKIDTWTAEDGEFKLATIPGSPEEKRDAALQAADDQMKSDIDDVNQDVIGFGRRGGQGRRRAIVAAFNERKAAIEEEYYAACM